MYTCTLSCPPLFRTNSKLCINYTLLVIECKVRKPKNTFYWLKKKKDRLVFVLFVCWFALGMSSCLVLSCLVCCLVLSFVVLLLVIVIVMDKARPSITITRHSWKDSLKTTQDNPVTQRHKTTKTSVIRPFSSNPNLTNK
jgi:hypothetical protein